MTIVQAIFGHDKFGFGIENDEISVVASGKAALTICAAGKLCWGFGHPAGDVVE